MARAKRHYIPGQIWHITHRCHKREFLLKFAKDRRRWLQWLFEARRRFGLSGLNYEITSNHIHLLVADEKSRGVIPDSIKLIAGRAGSGYNEIQQPKRKKILINYERLKELLGFDSYEHVKTAHKQWSKAAFLMVTISVTLNGQRASLLGVNLLSKM
jgi:REP element-mobilizing transposase RayT